MVRFKNILERLNQPSREEEGEDEVDREIIR
jgi:hypothetical protein